MHTDASTGPDRTLDAVISELFSYQLEAGGVVRLVLEGINGTVTFDGEPGTDAVRVDGARTVRSDTHADAQDFLNQVAVTVLVRGEEIVIQTVQPSSTEGREAIVDYNLIIPERLDVEVAKARRAEAKKSTRHGTEFEDEAFSFVQGFAQARGDLPVHTGNTTGKIARCKKGDAVIELGPDHRASGALHRPRDEGGPELHRKERARRNGRGPSPSRGLSLAAAASSPRREPGPDRSRCRRYPRFPHTVGSCPAHDVVSRIVPRRWRHR